MDHDEIVSEIEESSPMVVGLSAAGVHALPNLIRLIVAIRIAAPAAQIVVGGNVTELSDELTGTIGADFLVHDVKTALADLEAKFSLKA